MKKHLHYFLSLLAAMAFTGSVSAATFTVQPGDTLSLLARMYGTTVSALADINGIRNPDRIQAGQVLTTDGPLGAAIPTVVAVYTDSLASRISSSATSFTLTRGTDKQSRSLSGFYGFVLDEGTTSEEFMTANCVATACTIVARGLDVVDGETAVTALKFEHRRGATAKITNFPQLAILSRILNGQESASSTFSFGGGNTTGNKCLKADNGTAALPFLCYNETLSRWQFSDDGLSTITFVTSSAGGLTASSTKSIFITDSKIGVNASTTRGLAQVTGGDGNLYISASSTGGVNFASDGSLQVDQTDNFNFTGTVTTTGVLRVQSPTQSNDAVNLAYLQNQLNSFTATGTAASTITSGKALFISSTSTLGMTNTANGTSTFFFIGFSTASASAAAEVTYTRPGGVNCQQSGLTPGAYYYLNGSSGAISVLAMNPNSARVGMALSATCIQVLQPKYKLTGSTSTGAAANASTFRINTFFYPASISAVASGSGSNFFSVTTDSNSGVVGGDVAGAMRTNGGDYLYFEDEGGSCYWRGAVAKDQYGFTVTNDNYGGAGCGNMVDTNILYSVTNE